VPAIQSRPKNVTPTTSNATRPGKVARPDRSLPTAPERAVSISLVRDEIGYQSGESFLTFDPAIAARGPTAIKRLIDIVVAATSLLVLSPLIVLIVLAIRIESRGRAFFPHRRLGRAGRLFNCWKFRSMIEDAEGRLHADDSLRHHYVSNHFKIPEHLDPRITPLGRFLRRTSLDELPQLWNVLRGDMSLVGPRPIVPLESSYYGEEIATLLSVRPGLTGAWAVHGRNQLGYPMRAAIELDYARTWSLTTDVRILARTPSAVFSEQSANGRGGNRWRLRRSLEPAASHAEQSSESGA
jgi:lipopolysaccharide/colanic/teichoic acid biosynthesis glycosyltransferase